MHSERACSVQEYNRVEEKMSFLEVSEKGDKQWNPMEKKKNIFIIMATLASNSMYQAPYEAL